jgi:hypothetical protein
LKDGRRFKRGMRVGKKERQKCMLLLINGWIVVWFLGKLNRTSKYIFVIYFNIDFYRPYHYSPDPSLIFSGIIACATSLPPSDLEVLSAGITALGGQWRTGLTKDVTHLFAMSPDSQKYATAMHFRKDTGIKIVLPHWFDDAIRLGMGGLSTEVYEWPDPEMLRNPLGVGGGEQEVSVAKKNMYAMAALFTAPMHQSSSPPLKDLEMATGARNRLAVNVWKGKRIILSRTLQLFERRREAVEVGIERAGGIVVKYDGDGEIDEGFGVIGGTGEELSKREKEIRKNEADAVLDCDILVTRWRDGTAYVVVCLFFLNAMVFTYILIGPSVS